MLYLAVNHPKHAECEKTLVSKFIPQNDPRAELVYSHCRKTWLYYRIISTIIQPQLPTVAL